MPHTRSSRRKKGAQGSAASVGGGDGQDVPPTKRPKVRRRRRHRGRRNTAAAAADAPSSQAGTVTSGGGASRGGRGTGGHAGQSASSCDAPTPVSAGTAAGSICDAATGASPRRNSQLRGGGLESPPASERAAKAAAAQERGIDALGGFKDAQDGDATGELPQELADGVADASERNTSADGDSSRVDVEGSATAEAASRLQGAACRLREARTAVAAAVEACNAARDVQARLLFALDAQRAAADAERAQRDTTAGSSDTKASASAAAAGRPVVRARDRAVEVAAAAVTRQARAVQQAEEAAEAAERALQAAQEEANAAFYAVGAAMAVENGCVGHAARTQTFSGTGSASVSGAEDDASVRDSHGTPASRRVAADAGSYAQAQRGDTGRGTDDAGGALSVPSQAAAASGALTPDFDFEDPPHADSRAATPEPAAAGDSGAAQTEAASEEHVTPSPSVSTRASDPAAGSVVSREPARSHASVPRSPAYGAAHAAQPMMPPPMMMQMQQQQHQQHQQAAAAAWHAGMMRAQHAHAQAVRQGLAPPAPFMPYPRGPMVPLPTAYGAMPPSPPGAMMHPHAHMHPMARGPPMVMMMPHPAPAPYAGSPPQFHGPAGGQYRPGYPHPSFAPPTPPQLPYGHAARRASEGTDNGPRSSPEIEGAARGVQQLSMASDDVASRVR